MDPLNFLGELLAAAAPPEESTDQLLLVVAGEEYYLDAQAGSATLADPAGVGVFSDFDGDGRVDHVSFIDAAGEVFEWDEYGEVAPWGIAGI